MAESYEESRRKRMDENRKRVEALNLPLLSHALHNSSNSKTKSSPLKRMKSSIIEQQAVEVRRSSRVANMPAIVEPQTCLSAPIAPSVSQPQTSDGCATESTAPTNSQSSDPTNSQPAHGERTSIVTRHAGRKSSNYWWVDAIDENGVTIKLQLTVKKMNDIDDNLRIVVECDEFDTPIGEAAGLLAGVCGQMATDCLLFPISFESWDKMPKSFFERQWTNFFKAHFLFKANDERKVKHYLLQSISKKWREHRLKLWNKTYDPRLSRDETIGNVPKGVNDEQWALFVDYRLKPSTKELCKRNQEIRSKQTIPHTTGAKSLARRRAEMMKETGREVGRGEMWKLTHKKKYGSYINAEASAIAEKIDEHMSDGLGNGFGISSVDALGQVFGKEHPGRVRGLGMGVVPTMAFNRTTTHNGGMSSCSASTSSPQVQQELETMRAQIQALCAYIAVKEGGRMPEELAMLFPNLTSQAPDIGSGAESPNEIRRSSDGSNNNLSTNPRSPHA